MSAPLCGAGDFSSLFSCQPQNSLSWCCFGHSRQMASTKKPTEHHPLSTKWLTCKVRNSRARLRLSGVGGKQNFRNIMELIFMMWPES